MKINKSATKKLYAPYHALADCNYCKNRLVVHSCKLVRAKGGIVDIIICNGSKCPYCGEELNNKQL